jgi:hypothetical protein
MILSLSGFIQDITCIVTGITEVLIMVTVMVMILIIMILSTRVRTIMDHTGQDTGQDSGHLIHITLTGEVLIIIIPAFTMEIQEGRMMYM